MIEIYIGESVTPSKDNYAGFHWKICDKIAKEILKSNNNVIIHTNNLDFLKSLWQNFNNQTEIKVTRLNEYEKVEFSTREFLIAMERDIEIR